jgi:hypothetical protein
MKAWKVARVGGDPNGLVTSVVFLSKEKAETFAQAQDGIVIPGEVSETTGKFTSDGISACYGVR